MSTDPYPTILVLGGGPDSEREVSIRSAKGIAGALAVSGFKVVNQTIDRLSADELKALPGEVIFPILHGGWGEGGPLQDVLEADGRAFVGSMSRAARHAMDKIATKFTALALGITTTPVHVLDLRDSVCPLPYPAIVKPVHEGSTVGLFVCTCDEDWAWARKTIDESRATGDARAYMIEPCITRRGGGKARELTVGLLDNRALPIIEIVPADGLYDYEAKYIRNDTTYIVEPTLPQGLTRKLQEQTAALAKVMGIRHLARADFMLDDEGNAWFLEINTAPGFTDHSLVPKAAKHEGIEMPELCRRLVELAIRDAQTHQSTRKG